MMKKAYKFLMIIVGVITTIGLMIYLSTITLIPTNVDTSLLLQDLYHKAKAGYQYSIDYVFNHTYPLVLINKDNPIPEGYEVKIKKLSAKDGEGGNEAVDERIYPQLVKMFEAMRKKGLKPMVISSYRSAKLQKQIMNDTIKQRRREGYSKKEAERLAKLQVAPVGFSEHQIGLAVDVSSTNYDGKEIKKVWDWLKKHAHEYGFIIRYPKEKQKITHTMNEPWHLRYVGVDDAKAMKDNNLCLEEYIEYKKELLRLK